MASSSRDRDSARRRNPGGRGRATGGSGRAGRQGHRDSAAGRGRTPDKRASSVGRDAARSKARRDLSGAAADLPRWVVDDLSRVTPHERVAAALAELGAASNAMVEGRYKAALRSAKRAKELAPRDATVRETLGLAAYRTGEWQTALKELRAYRRIAGDATHLPVEMDVLRALGRDADVTTAWKELSRARVGPAVTKEGLVVYASFLIDSGRLEEARRLTTPHKLASNPYPADLRVWYVAARANALAGDGRAARQLRDAITLADPAFPGLDELDKEIGRLPLG